MKAVFWPLAAMTWISATALPGALALAAGGGATDFGGGAGGVVVLPDDTVKLADPYVVDPDSGLRKSYLDINPLIRREIERIGYFMVRYGADVDDTVPAPPGARPTDEEKKLVRKGNYMTRAVQAKFIIEQIEDPQLIDYYFVDVNGLPSSCQSSFASQAGDIPTTSGIQVKEFGCTMGTSTYIVKSLFAALSVRDQALAIVHERLHALGLQNQETLIADIVAGLDTVLDLYNQQQATSSPTQKNRPVLNDTQTQTISMLIKRIAQMGLADGNPAGKEEFLNWKIAQSGGGLYDPSATLSPYAYLGVGSLLGKEGIMDAMTSMINFSCYNAACELMDGASVSEGAIAPAPLTPNGWDDFDQDPAFRAVIGRNTQFAHSTFIGPILKADPNNKDANLALFLDDGSTVSTSFVSGARALTLGARASVSGSRIEIDHSGQASVSLALGAGASLQSLDSLPPGPPDGPWSTRQAGTIPITISVPAGTVVDFKNTAVCQDPQQQVLLRSSVTLNVPNALAALCAK